MTQPIDHLEVSLAESLQQLARRYSSVLDLARELPQTFDSSSALEQRIARMQDLMNGVARFDDSIAAKRRAWESRGRPAGPQLRAAHRQVKETLEELIGLVDQVEQSAANTRDRLIPQLDQQQRNARMRAAYQQSGRYAATGKGA